MLLYFFLFFQDNMKGALLTHGLVVRPAERAVGPGQRFGYVKLGVCRGKRYTAESSVVWKVAESLDFFDGKAAGEALRVVGVEIRHVHG